MCYGFRKNGCLLCNLDQQHCLGHRYAFVLSGFIVSLLVVILVMSLVKLLPLGDDLCTSVEGCLLTRQECSPPEHFRLEDAIPFNEGWDNVLCRPFLYVVPR